MKLEVGMYVRTKKGIGKIETIEEDRTEIHFNCDSGLSIGFVKRGFTQEEIANMYKHNHNIKDLIEVGDIIKYKIDNVPLETKGYLTGVIEIEDNQMLHNIKENKDYHILSILTKEQFEAMVYKVVE